MKLYQLYEDYINSYEFIDEINRLKQKKWMTNILKNIYILLRISSNF